MTSSSCYLFSFLLTVLFVLGLIKVILKLLTNWDRSPTCLVGKTTIVTGANTGIGYYTALDFAKRGAKVILACRDKNRAEEAKEKIIKATGNQNVIVHIVDFASLSSVRAFAKQINSTEERLDILVNNAGIGLMDNPPTEDGLNSIIQVNHFGPFLLTNLLIELLKKSGRSRIVNVSSIGAQSANLDVDDLNKYAERGTKGSWITYCNSKLLNILFTNELARKLKGTGVVANSLHPGSVGTEIFRHTPGLLHLILTNMVFYFFKTPEEGAQTTIYVAVSKETENVTGEYFDNCKIAWAPAMPKIARDEDLAKKVWEKSEKFVKLTSEERKL